MNRLYEVLTSNRRNPTNSFRPIHIQNSSISFLCLFVEVVVVFPFYGCSLEYEKGAFGAREQGGGVTQGECLLAKY